MSVIRFWEKDYCVQYTFESYRRLIRLSEQLADEECSECRAINMALALFYKAVHWEDYPVFRRSFRGEYELINISDYALGPYGPYAYNFRYFSSWQEWFTIRRMLNAANIGDTSILFGRALELLELHFDGRLPDLYTFNNELDYVRYEYPLDSSLG
jgi:hypothetical protein